MKQADMPIALAANNEAGAILVRQQPESALGIVAALQEILREVSKSGASIASIVFAERGLLWSQRAVAALADQDDDLTEADLAALRTGAYLASQMRPVVLNLQEALHQLIEDGNRGPAYDTLADSRAVMAILDELEDE